MGLRCFKRLQVEKHSMDPSRRSFLRGRPERGTQAVRPPWSLPEARFTQRCTRCGDCIQRCETGVLQKGDGGFPEIRFAAGGCSFCGECVEACKPGALHITPGAKPWLFKASIGISCLTRQKVVCRTCGEHCERGAIRFRLERGGIATPQVDPASCNGCGMCVADCPSHAITLHSAEKFEEALA